MSLQRMKSTIISRHGSFWSVFQKHIDEALSIINAFGDVTAEHLKRDYDQVFTIAIYSVFLRDFLNMLK